MTIMVFLILSMSKSVVFELSVSSQPFFVCVRSRSNPISAADLGPLDLSCLYQNCFMLCLLNSKLQLFAAEVNSLVYRLYIKQK